MFALQASNLTDDQLAALDIMQSVASEGLSNDDQTTLDGIADVIAGRTFGEAEAKAHIEALRAELKRRHNV